MRGLPASGKSTYAEELRSEMESGGDSVQVISLDQIRAILFGHLKSDQPLDQKREGLCLSHQSRLVKKWLDAGFSVIVDNMHLKENSMDNLLDYLRRSIDFDFDVSQVDLRQGYNLVSLFSRNKNRDIGVDPNFLIKLFIDNRKKLGLPVFRQTEANYEDPYRGKMNTVIVDIDGTIAHMTNRSPCEWNKVEEDVPDQRIIQLISEYAEEVVFVTGRSEECRDLTEWWIGKHTPFSNSRLFMRPKGDNVRDDVLKARIFMEQIEPHFYVDLVFDDRSSVVDMWRNVMGLKTLQVADGNF